MLVNKQNIYCYSRPWSAGVSPINLASGDSNVGTTLSSRITARNYKHIPNRNIHLRKKAGLAYSTQFSNAGTSDTARCCSTQTANGPSGTPIPVAPTASVINPCPNNTCVTALGPIKVGDQQFFVTKLFQVILSLAGGIALLLIIYSGYSLSLSQGNPEKVQGAKETLTSAIIGLVFIILSLVILQIIGVDILQLPGFKK